ncbi:hypothetical protein [Pseudomonas vranovensis]|uniref:Uncharacterized protein n=1 Tax=Pseudomonas vranovensis TaxID=321661 RepID=A0A423CZ60_9PSED|nr:hypothetical protein [Pseudomonas vranovensis]ROL64571.1 hypothetical protein BHU25_22075 [Pseudomonas vranovensis]
MPRITITTTIKAVHEVPEGLTIEQVRHQALPFLSEDEEATDDVVCRQDSALARVYMGAHAPVMQSVEHSIVEGSA